MSRNLVKQTNFASGELTPALDGRSDLDRYYNGCRTMLNWYPIVQGGARRAPGTVFLAELFGPTRLLAFVAGAGAENQYLFALRAGVLDIYQNNALLQTLAAPWTAAQLPELDATSALDTVVFCHQWMPTHRLYRDASLVFHLEDLFDTANTIHITNIPTEPRVKRWFGGIYRFLGDFIQPSLTKDNGYYYECYNDGASGSTEPTWTTTVGNSETDGGAKFYCRGLVSDLYLWGPTQGYPRCCTFEEDRLVLAGSPKYPHRRWLSQTSDYFNFDLGTGLDSDGIDRDLLADELPVIQWVHSGRKLIFGTTMGEFAVVQSTPITPAEMQTNLQTTTGSARIAPVSVDGAVLHVTQNGKQIRELLYNDVEQAFGSKSLSLLASLAVTGAVQLAVKPAVDYDDANLVYVVNSSGMVGVLSTLRDQDFLAWCRRTFTGQAESVACVGGKVYVVVSYTYGPGTYESGVYASGVYEESGGSSNRYLCAFDDDAVMDFQVTGIDATAKLVWPGFSHLAGSTVQVLADGVYVGDQVVATDGSVTLEVEANTVTAGIALPTPTLTLMPVSFDGQLGTVAHLLKRLIRTLIQVQDTASLYADGQAIDFREAQQIPGAPIVPFSGVKIVSKLGRDREATVTFTAPDPLPATILSLTREVSL